MTEHLTEADMARLARMGVHPLSTPEASRCSTPPTPPAMRSRSPRAWTPRRCAAWPAWACCRRSRGASSARRRAAPRRRAPAARCAQRLSAVPEPEREQLVLELLRGQIALVLGHASPEGIDVRLAFKDIGFDSLTAVELRNRLDAATGLRLPATVIFDHPTPVALARHILAATQGTGSEQAPAATTAAALARSGEDLVAIVGMSCRYPGGVGSAQELWELVASGSDAIGGFPTDRGWDLEHLYDPDPSVQGKSYAREGGFLYDAPLFDAAFFGISPREALAMDPQQRLLLEAAWEAFEDAEIDPEELRETATGVFAGISSQDYTMLGGGSIPGSLEGFFSTGISTSAVSGRVAYTFGFEGPAVTVDTACSSSLVALHLACQALRGGECSLALAGGVTVLSWPSLFIDFARLRGLARDGRCKAFADAADGAGFSEGVGVVLLERLSDAQREGHRILGVVRGSALNQDGASNGLSAPNGPSQQRVIAQALANAGLSPGDVNVVEAHGTGTTLGDPIEAQALLAAYGGERPSGQPVWLGSVKSNIGHAQAAAGMAGVIKMLMAMRHSSLPPTLHIDEPSSHVDWSTGAVELLTETVPWARGERPRRAGVSSFGISGTNAHVILEEPPVPGRSAGDGSAGDEAPAGEESSGEDAPVLGGEVVPWALSGRGSGSLLAQSERLFEHLGAHPEVAAGDVGLSLAARPTLNRRAVVVGAHSGAMQRGLGLLGRGEPGVSVVEGTADGLGAARVIEGVAAIETGAVFVFSGQGGQWLGMGRELLRDSPAFARELARCDEALAPHVGWSLLALLRGEEGAPELSFGEGDAELPRVNVVQPALFGVMVALAGLWRACGVQPSAVVGHSQGEIAAAHVAGALSLKDAARVVAVRSRLLVGLMGRGGMVSVALPAAEVEPWLERTGGAVSIAALNGPRSVVVSGERRALDGLLAELVAAGVRAREVPVGYASHSAQIDEVREELLEGCAGIEPVTAGVPFYSTVTDGFLDTARLDAEYWFANLRQPVLLERAVRGLLDRGQRAFVEVGPHPVLTVGLQETVEDALGDAAGNVVIAATLRRDDGGLERFLTSLGEVWVRGVDVDWGAVFAGSPARRVGLPAYAFQRERYWLRTRGSGDVTAVGLARGSHPLLGAAVGLAAGSGFLFTGRLSLADQAWLADHCVMGTVLLPGAAFLDMALHAAEQVGCDLLRELVIEAPLVLGAQGAVQLQVSVGEPDAAGARSIEVHSRPEGAAEDGLDPTAPWTRHAGGVLGAEAPSRGEGGEGAGAPPAVGGAALAEPTPPEAWPPADARAIDMDGLYDRLAEWGLEYGPVFQGLTAAWERGGEVFAEVSLPESEGSSQAGEFVVHPALLDAALHSQAAALLDAGAQQGQIELPFAWENVHSGAPGAPSAASLRVRLVRADSGEVSLLAHDGEGALVLRVGALKMRPVSPEALSRAGGAQQDSLFGLQWVSIPAPPEGPAPEVVLLDLREDARDDLPGAAHSAVNEALRVVQGWLEDESLASSRLVVLTRDAVAAAPGDRVEGLAHAAVWGLLRSAQSENPDRLLLRDLDGSDASESALAAALASEEPQLALREGALLAPRLTRTAADGALAPPAGEPLWRLDMVRRGTFEGLKLLACPQAGRAARATRGALRGARRRPELPRRADRAGRLSRRGAAGRRGRGGRARARQRRARSRRRRARDGPHLGRIRTCRRERRASAGAHARGVVLRHGRLGADRLPHGRRRADRPRRPGRGRAGARARRRRWCGHGGGAVRTAPRSRGVRHREPRQVGGAGSAGPRSGAHRLLAHARLQGGVPCAHRRRGRRRGAQLPGAGVRGRLAGAAAAGRPLRRDGQDRPARPREDRGAAPRSRLPAPGPRRNGPATPQ